MVPGIKNLFVRNYIEKCLRDLLEMQEMTDIISYVLLIHIKNSMNNFVMKKSEVGFVHYHQIKQHKHYI